MALNTIQYEADGTLSVDVVFGNAQVGSYEVFVWDSQAKEKESVGKGSNSEGTPEPVKLTQPPSFYNQRILQCVATIIAPDPQPNEQFSAQMVVKQDGNERGNEALSGAIDEKPVSVQLVARLTMNGGGPA